MTLSLTDTFLLRLFGLALLIAGLTPAAAVAQLTNRAEITPGLYFELWKSPEQARRGGGNTNLFQGSDMINYQISGTRTQIVGRLPQSESFVLDLRDASGNPVPKTRFGQDNSRSVNMKTKRARDLKVKLGGVTPTMVLLREAFRPEEYFVITNPGVYTLHAQIRVWTKKTNGQFGVVLSQPVRVEVEKH